MSNQFSLLGKRRFAPLFWTQFFGAFNDNVYKNALIILIAFQLAAGDDGNLLINLAAGLFILPFFLFSATAGQIADKYEKSQLIRGIKLLEIGIMGIGSFALMTGNVVLLMSVLFLMGTQSTLFGPVKYSILPQQLTDQELTGGNGMVEMGTFVAILMGTLAGGLLIGIDSNGALYTSGALISVAILGYLASRAIPNAPASAPDLKINWNPVTETIHTVGILRDKPAVMHSIVGISWFWFFGAIYLTQLPNYTRLVLGGNEEVVTLLLALFSLGVGLGSVLCERLSSGRIELGLVPFGAIGLTGFAVDLWFATPVTPSLVAGEYIGAAAFLDVAGSWRIVADVVLIGLFGGFYIVPLYTLVQARTAAAYRSRVIAANNILNALFMVISAAFAAGLLAAGLSIPELFMIVAVMNAAVAIYICTLVPEFFVRFIAWILISVMYRVRKVDLHHVPEDGPAVLVCNHVSFIDSLLIGTCVSRPPRFVMYYKFYELPIAKFIFRAVNAIPIASARENPEMLAKAMDDIATALENGEVVCIFPEGKLTADGEMNDFRTGVEQIIERTPVPVIPTALSGLWGSWFSRLGGSAGTKFPRRFRAKLTMSAGPAVPPNEVDAAHLFERVAALRGDIA